MPRRTKDESGEGNIAMTLEAAAEPLASARREDRITILRVIDTIAETVVATALVGELLAVLAHVFARVFFHNSFLWADEIARFSLSIIAFIGGAVAYRRGGHAFVRILVDLAPKRIGLGCLALSDIIVLFVAALAGIASWDFVMSSWNERTPIFQVSAAFIAMPLPIGMALLMLYSSVNLFTKHRSVALPVGIGFAAVLAIASLTRDIWLDWLGADAGIITALSLFLVAILAGVPVGFVLILSTLTYLWATDATSFAALPQTMVNGTGSFILLAVPFFILAGLIMERGGISLRLVKLIHSLVGHMRGGILQVTVGSMYVVSGLSGSKPADVAAVGTVMRDELTERHGAPEGAAVLAASAIMGETIPPSIAMLIVGSITNVSVAAMFIGGLIPAAIMALCLVIMIYVRARLNGTPKLPRPPFSLVISSAKNASLALLMPLMLLGGVLFGFATPTEIAAVAVVYGLAVAVFVYRQMGGRDLINVTIDTAALTGVLLFIFAAASAFSWTLTVAYLPQRLVTLLSEIGNSATVFMILSIILLIVVGVLLEGLPSLNVLAPLLLPIAAKLGISELHYALVIIIAMGVGGFMPLAGVGFYVCCAVMRCDVEAASKAMLPYLAVVLIGLLIVAFVPWFSLALPHWFGFRG
jgi:tripartite ATP-independent transporter DctM subunit